MVWTLKRLHPEWEKAASEITGAKLANVDCTEETEIAKEFGISGYPTIKWFANGEAVEYNGPRESDGIQQWVRKRLNPVPSFETEEALNDFVALAKRVLVVESLDRDSDFYKSLLKFANSQDEVAVASVSAGVSSGIRLITPDGQYDFDGDQADIVSWVNENAFPLVEQVVEATTFQRLFSGDLPFALVWFDLSDDSSESQIEELKAFAETLKDSFRFAWLDNAQWGRVLPQVGASGNVVPTSAAWSKGDAQAPPIVWDESNEWNMDAFKTWVQQVIDGTAKTWEKSEEAPADNDGPVRVLVWNNFQEDVINSNKNVFVAFHAPWCGHCKNLMPIWDELGEKFADNDSIVVAKMDATANHVPAEYGVKGFPTLKFFVAGQETPLDYNGARTLEALSDFVNENSA
eukprot:CAMPEP_0201547652 /NCGR_PEP_ID=MMETSP0173_2-20130828/4130_1 /ASSEMBLY_ACC=CAM_ASM_000268 /TAXON_ID=218659 /ORGANISM="Vexillifera sp., Strain DIVA3 564/2" /LENGTH=403 /DNA_ID=CAMNT_0047956769 /DNA_START=165 /DNA_END=1377 /DNA_ORIENTATION=+